MNEQRNRKESIRHRLCSSIICFILLAVMVGTTTAEPNPSGTRAERLNRGGDATSPVVDLTYIAHPKREKARVQISGLFDQTVLVAMRDGVHLSTTIYKLPLGGPWPTIVARTPYGKGQLEALALILLPQGYAVVAQDMRGRFASEGEDLVFQCDGWGDLQDGYDTIEWAAQQSWCNGKIGTWGYSALAIAEYLAAGAAPPHLLCQVIGFSPSKSYGQVSYQGGAFRQSLVTGWLTDNGSLHMLPVYRAHPAEDEFWDQTDIEPRNPLVNAPALYTGGWYDCFEEGTLQGFKGRQENGGPGARGRNQLVMGPWTHTNQMNRRQGEIEYPLNSLFTTEIYETLRWFDFWLKGDANGIDREAAVTYYVMGANEAGAPGNEWREASQWPPAAQDVPFYLQPDGSLGLTESVAVDEFSPLALRPQWPVPTRGGFNLEIPAGPYDQRSLEGLGDVQIYSTPPLDAPMEITGKVRAVVYAASNLSDNDLTVRLTDVYPDGRSMLICDGILRAAFRESTRNPTPIEPGSVYRYEIDLWSTSIAINQGHRLRVIVANTNSPRFETNPLYSRLGQDGNPENAETRIYYSQYYPSAIILPVAAGAPNVGVHDWQRY